MNHENSKGWNTLKHWAARQVCADQSWKIVERAPLRQKMYEINRSNWRQANENCKLSHQAAVCSHTTPLQLQMGEKFCEHKDR